MASAEIEAKKLRAKDTAENGRTPTWPPCERTTVLQIRTFPQSLLTELKILALRMQKKLPEVAALVITRGLEAVNKSADEAKDERS